MHIIMPIMEKTISKNGEDHTKNGEDHTKNGEDHTKNGEDHIKNGEDHNHIMHMIMPMIVLI